MDWIKRDNGNTVAEIVQNNTGMSVDDLLNDEREYNYPGIDESADLTMKHVREGNLIGVYTDYDTDGVCCTDIIKHTFSFLHISNVKIVTPRRFTDGYGINVDRIDEFIADGVKLLITLDNGIAANEAIKKAKDAGMDVIVLDHHQPRVNEAQEIILPEADVIVDPHITGGDFDDLCGAGIALKFVDALADRCHYLSDKQRFMIHSRACAFAAVGTVGDVVSLTYDNRKIVKEGIDYIQKGNCTKGLKSLCNTFGMEYVTSMGIGFGLSAGINAAGRLLDDGAKLMTNLLAYVTDSEDLQELCLLAKERNNERKRITKESVKKATDSFLAKSKIDDFIVYYDDELSTGIAGLVAGKLTEEYNRPSVVLCPNPNDKDVAKGSGRSIESVDLKALLDAANKHLLGYGGHPAAAGLSLNKENIDILREALNEMAPEAHMLTELPYDLTLEPTSENLMKFFVEDKPFEPHGAGNPEIVIRLDNIQLGDDLGNIYRVMGEESEHVKLFGPGFDLIWFNSADKYRLMGKPRKISCIGTVSMNVFNGKAKLQFQVQDLKAA